VQSFIFQLYNISSPGFFTALFITRVEIRLL